ncbi:MAG: phospholipid carrier-dependent glycosyltransferase, partial [Elusimicrobia bacterium]|nr:phospholipid carrier-dependent glycosyltransferase [Elusimicrobiota bacterium]
MNPFRVSVYWILPLTLLCAVPYSSPFLSYVWNHPQTLTVRCWRTLAGHALDFGFVSILFLGFYHWGRVFLNQFFPLPSRNLTPPEKFLFSAFIGESLIAYVLLTLGLLHAFHSLSFWFLFLFLFYGAGRECKKTITTFPQIKELNALKIPFPALVLLILLGLAAIRSLITTCAPPTDWDTLVYHLAFPKIFLGNGQLLRLPWAINAHYPLNTEMIYTLALAIQGELAAHWINFWHGGLLLATTACLLRRYFGKEAILLALATFALQPIFQRVIGNASTDFPIAWAGLLSFFCFFRAQETLQETTVSQETARPWYLLTGLCCGLAMGYKLTGTWIAATVSILILSSKFQRPFFLWT